jgi:hypothetical protein
MTGDEVAWPTGMSDHDPAARDRPLVFNPQGFLVAVLEDTDQAEQARAALVDYQVLHFRHYGHNSQQDLHIR